MDEYTYNRYQVMRELLEMDDLESKAILDVGSGVTPISLGVKAKRKIFLDIRIDNKPSIVCNFYQGLPIADNSIYVIIAGEILEHIAHSRLFLREFSRVLVDGGGVVLSVPNIVSLKYRMAFLIGKIPSHAAKADYTYGANSPAVMWGHVRDYSFEEIRKVLYDNGFNVIAERSIGLHWRGKRIVPPWAMPLTFSDNVIVKAILSK